MKKTRTREPSCCPRQSLPVISLRPSGSKAAAARFGNPVDIVIRVSVCRLSKGRVSPPPTHCCSKYWIGITLLRCLLCRADSELFFLNCSTRDGKSMADDIGIIGTSAQSCILSYISPLRYIIKTGCRAHWTWRRMKAAMASPPLRSRMIATF